VAAPSATPDGTEVRGVVTKKQAQWPATHLAGCVRSGTKEGSAVEVFKGECFWVSVILNKQRNQL